MILPLGLWRDTGQITLPLKEGLGGERDRGLLLFVRLGEIFIQRSRDERARKAGDGRLEEAWKKRVGHGHQEGERSIIVGTISFFIRIIQDHLVGSELGLPGGGGGMRLGLAV